MDVFKQDAQITVQFTTDDVAALQSILLRHLAGEAKLDDPSWETITDLCTRIDQCAKDQMQTVSKEVEF